MLVDFAGYLARMCGLGVMEIGGTVAEWLCMPYGIRWYVVK